MAVRGKRIAFSGIDGAGKSTLIRDLLSASEFSNAIVQKKTFRDNANRLVTFHRTSSLAPEAYSSGPFAVSQRWAYAFDFLGFYRLSIEPLWEDSRPMLLDRWVPCIHAWTIMLGENDAKPILELAKCLPSVDLLVHLDIDPIEAHRRVCRRGQPRPDERLGVLIEFRKAYETALKLISCPILRIGDLSRPERVRLVREYLIRDMT